MEYTTLGKEATVTLTEKKSVFIATAFPCAEEDKAVALVNEVRKKHPDARHTAFAYLLSDGKARCSDDGEPQGTAGVPILGVIQKGGFTDALITVTRYFGGILLGAPGLVRAYGGAARDAVKAAGTVIYQTYTEFEVRCGYSDYQKLLPLIKHYGIKELETGFGESVNCKFAVKESLYGEIEKKISEIGSGRIIAEVTGSRYGV